MPANKDDCNAEAASLGLLYGDTHPDTGMVYIIDRWATQAAYHRRRRGSLLAGAEQRARAKGLPFNLTPAWLKAVWPPNGRCEVFAEVTLEWCQGQAQSCSPSIDRIRPDLGYVQTNCRVISMRANTLKSNATRRELEAVLADLIKHESAD